MEFDEIRYGQPAVKAGEWI